MRFLSSHKFWKHVGLIGLALNLSAFTSPQKDDLVELQGNLYGRSDSKFRTSDRNKIYVLKPGTRAVVMESKFFSDTKNYGLCLQIQNAADVAPDQKCIWVYYDVKNPALKLYSGITDKAVRKQILDAWAKDDKKVTLKSESNPAKAQFAQTTRTVSGVGASSSPAAKDLSVAAKAEVQPSSPAKASTAGIDSETPVRLGIQSLDQVNRNADKAMSSNGEPCVECSKPKLAAFEKCNSKNDYMENSLSAMLNQSAYSAFFQSPQKEIITESCIQANMSVFPKSASFFRNCGSGSAGRHVPKACLSENYVDITAKSFNLAADCLGDYVSKNKSAKGQVALSIFSLMSLESGLNVNAMSGTGPGGPGQMSGGAITAVNQELGSIRSHLAKAENPQCSQVLAKALAKPMSSTVSCDRISANKDNPLKSMAYAFAYQALTRRILEKQAFNDGIFKGVISPNLPTQQRERLIMEVTAWAHNTGPAGMKNPVRAIMMNYLRNHKSIETASDVTQFLKNLRPYLASHASSSNRGSKRITETMNYYNRIQARMAEVKRLEPGSCLAN